MEEVIYLKGKMASYMGKWLTLIQAECHLYFGGRRMCRLILPHCL